MKKTASANIRNLTQLWTLAGKEPTGYGTEHSIRCAMVQGSEWPNKIWIDQAPTGQLLKRLRKKMHSHPQLTFSYFNPNAQDNPQLAAEGFELQFNQTGMSLRLESKFKTRKDLIFCRVENPEQARQWATTFGQAFGYDFGANTVLETMLGVPYYLVYHGESLVGTVILYVTGQVAGIHALGIPPEKRKQGYATEIMYFTLNMALESGSDIATLQASEMAKNMYLKIGFTTDFLMQNYKLKQD